MGLSPAALDAHFAHWSAELDKPKYRYRKHWPSLLFHHAPLENAVAIHAPILVMFALDARSILSLPLVRFSDINMQVDAANDGDNDEFFATIDFEKVYHEGPWIDPSIKDHRGAEVLCPSPLAINDHLRWIICRSEAERQTLIWHTGPAIRPYRDRIRTSDDLRVFEKTFAFADRVSASNEGVIFRLNPRKDGQRLKVQVLVTNQQDQARLDVTYPELAAFSDTGASWIARRRLADGFYPVSVFIDDHLAYRNDHYVGEVLF